MKKIFISHSSRDKKMVCCLIRLLEDMGVQADRIFCSGIEGYGAPLGDNFLDNLKQELNEEIFVLLVLSTYFCNSAVCMCEMGVVWAKTSIHIPVIIPPFDFSGIKGVAFSNQYIAVNDKTKLNSLYNQIRKFFNIDEIDINKWESRRDLMLFEINQLLSDTQGIPAPSNDKLIEIYNRYGEYKALLNQSNEEIYRLKNKIVDLEKINSTISHVKNELTAIEEFNNRNREFKLYGKAVKDESIWNTHMDEAEKFELLISDVREKIGRIPYIVRKCLYFDCAGKEFSSSFINDLQEKAALEEALEDDYILIEGKNIIPNLRDPKIRKAIEALNNLKYFLNSATEEFHSNFEEHYEICAKIESKKFWNMMNMF